MNKIDISILEKKPNLSERVTVQINPLSSLSMVSDLPGSFYKSLKSPTNKMLCGLFENMLGWHFSFNHRNLIQKELIKLRKKQKIDFVKPQEGSTYIPLLMEYFKIDIVTLPEYFMYNDLWSKAYRRADADVHPKGTQNIHYELIAIKRNKERNPKKPKQIADSELLDLFKKEQGRFPLYYSTPTVREYIDYSQPVELTINIDKELLTFLRKNLKIQNTCYLGNSEGWINIKI